MPNTPKRPTGEYEGWPEGWTRPEQLSERGRQIRLRSFRFMRMFNFKEPDPPLKLGSYATDDPITHWECASFDVEIVSREENAVVVQWVTGWGDMYLLTFGKKVKELDGMKYRLDGVTADEFISGCLSIDLKVRGVNDDWTREQEERESRGNREGGER